MSKREKVIQLDKVLSLYVHIGFQSNHKMSP